MRKQTGSGEIRPPRTIRGGHYLSVLLFFSFFHGHGDWGCPW